MAVFVGIDTHDATLVMAAIDGAGRVPWGACRRAERPSMNFESTSWPNCFRELTH
jgi:hypothetical protein